ncbi:hypothetical protein HYDPIDRAFT_123264 [Hydnomerulius pinastri MD-312]|nr:hypothetical protein HYDPIDRAFT_123264 [Hydnomerulius pinastri MD-312]
MRLYFSTDHVRNSTITNSSGQALYKVVTPFRPFFMTGTSTIYKIIPNLPSVFVHRRLTDSETAIDKTDQTHHDDPGTITAGEDLQGMEEGSDFEGEEVMELDMRDRFAELAQIEFRRLTASTLRWFCLNKLGRGEMKTTEFIPYKTMNRNHRYFTGPDDQKYRWHLGLTVCKLYLENDSKNPVAQYHRYKSGLLPGDKPRCGFLEINLPSATKVPSKISDNTVDLDNYTDHELEASLDRDISPELLDTILVTFMYVEKLRREREQAAKKNIVSWNY